MTIQGARNGRMQMVLDALAKGPSSAQGVADACDGNRHLTTIALNKHRQRGRVIKDADGTWSLAGKPKTIGDIVERRKAGAAANRVLSGRKAARVARKAPEKPATGLLNDNGVVATLTRKAEEHEAKAAKIRAIMAEYVDAGIE